MHYRALSSTMNWTLPSITKHYQPQPFVACSATNKVCYQKPEPPSTTRHYQALPGTSKHCIALPSSTMHYQALPCIRHYPAPLAGHYQALLNITSHNYCLHALLPAMLCYQQALLFKNRKNNKNLNNPKTLKTKHNIHKHLKQISRISQIVKRRCKNSSAV